MCLGVGQAMALIGNIRQAMSEGKSGPVETGLTGPAATALYSNLLGKVPSQLLAFISQGWVLVLCIGIGTGGAPGARAPPSFQSVPYMFCATK